MQTWCAPCDEEWNEHNEQNVAQQADQVKHDRTCFISGGQFEDELDRLTDGAHEAHAHDDPRPSNYIALAHRAVCSQQWA